MRAHRGRRRALSGLLGLMILVTGVCPVSAQAPMPGAAPAKNPDSLRLSFYNAPLEMVLDEYSLKTGRTLLKGPNVPAATITLQSQGELSKEEYLQAIETVLGMYGIALLRVQEKFLKVVSAKSARMDAMPILEDADRKYLEETGRLVSQMIPLQHIDIGEAKPAIEPLKSANGQIHLYEHINGFLVTDFAENVNRIIQIITAIDQPVVAREEPHIIAIKFTKASDIKAKLTEIMAEADKKQARPSTVPQPRTSGAPGVKRPTTPPGVIRARQPAAAADARPEPEDVGTLIEEAERGIIRGDVKIVADDRTNILIIITRPENMKFFEKIINVLDVETAPDVVVKVFRMEFAEATSIAGMLNDLIGAANKDEDVPSGVSTGTEGEGAKSKTLREVTPLKPSTAAIARKSKVGELSQENIKILADERTNSLIIMASKGDMVAIEEIIGDMDMMLSQVLVEAMILEVSLDDTLESGVDWLQRSLIAYKNEANGTRRPIAAFAGSAGGGSFAPTPGLGFTSTGNFPTTGDGNPLGGLSYYLTLFELNTDMVLRMVASDSRTRILSSPVILTTDNKDATIDVSTERYFFKGKKYAGSVSGDPIYEDDVERKSVGITLTVTPRINEKKFVVMEILQEISNVSGTQDINGQKWPLVTTRKLEADIAVRSGDTIVLGGLVLQSESKSKSKIPVLGDIPILGWPFRSKRNEENKNEVIVFITPYVMDTPEEIESDTTRRTEALHTEGMWKRGWSDSKLAEPPGRPAADKVPQGSRRGQSRFLLGRKEEPASAGDPLKVLDPELADYIKEQDKRWERPLERVDQDVEKSLQDSP